VSLPMLHNLAYTVSGTTDLIFPEGVQSTGDRQVDVDHIDLFSALEDAYGEMMPRRPLPQLLARRGTEVGPETGNLLRRRGWLHRKQPLLGLRHQQGIWRTTRWPTCQTWWWGFPPLRS
jgi:hypothetical protein